MKNLSPSNWTRKAPRQNRQHPAPSHPVLFERAFLRWLALALVLSFTYALVRYNVFKGVPWAHVPLYVTNKAISLTSVLLIALAYLTRYFFPLTNRIVAVRKQLGLAGFGLAALHIAISMTLLGPYYYGKFFNPDGRMSLSGELSMLFGVLCFFVFAIPALTSLPGMFHALGEMRWRKSQKLGLYGLGLVGGHVFWMGFEGWIDPGHWPGMLPPISMLAFCVAAGTLLLRSFSTFFSPSKADASNES